MADLWDDEDLYWRESYASRPYASGGTYDTFQPGIATAMNQRNVTKGARGQMWSAIWSATGAPIRIAAPARGSRSRMPCVMRGTADRTRLNLGAVGGRGRAAPHSSARPFARM